jgi:IS1 family transposase
MVSMNRLTNERRAQILGMMVEGNSIRSIVRMSGASKNTIIKLLEDAGEAFSEYQDRVFHDLSCKRLQLDEIWAFCYAKQRNVMLAKAAPEDAGDLWTWVAIDAETKLVPSWRIGDRSGATAIEFVCDLSRRLASRVQVTSDGHRAYIEAIEAGFGANVDYAQLIKLYGEVPHPAGRYSPAAIQGTKTYCCTGKPDPAQKDREPRAFGRNPFHALQLRAHPSKPAYHARDGGGCHGQALVIDGHGPGYRRVGGAPVGRVACRISSPIMASTYASRSRPDRQLKRSKSSLALWPAQYDDCSTRLTSDE